MTKKLLIVFGILVAVIIGYYLVGNRNQFIQNDTNFTDTTGSSLSVNTQSWLTYKNQKYNYELKYPEKAKIENFNDEKIITFRLADALGVPYKLPDADAPDGKERFSFTISSAKAQDNLTLDQWIASEKSQRQAPQPTVEKKITLSGKEAYYLEYSSGASFKVDPYYAIAIYTIQNGIQYRISGLKVPSDIRVKDFSYEFALYYELIFGEMLTSFKFTE